MEGIQTISTLIERQRETEETPKQLPQELQRQMRELTSSDLYANKPAAERDEVASAIRTLTAAFPNVSGDFWALLSNRFRVLGYSRERLQYILHIAIDTDRLTNQYRYGRLTVADFTSITKPITYYSYIEALENEDLVLLYDMPDKPTFAHFATREEAKESGYRWEEFLRRK